MTWECETTQLKMIDKPVIIVNHYLVGNQGSVDIGMFFILKTRKHIIR